MKLFQLGPIFLGILVGVAISITAITIASYTLASAERVEACTV